MYQQLYKASPVTCHAYMMEVARRVATEQGPAAADDVKLKLVSLIDAHAYVLSFSSLTKCPAYACGGTTNEDSATWWMCSSGGHGRP